MPCPSPRLALALALATALATSAPAGLTTVHGSDVLATPSRDILLTEAKIHLARGRWKEAAYALDRSLHEHPDNLAIAYRLATLYYENRHYQEAISLLRAYLDRSSPERNLYYALGLCYHKTNRLRDALGMYARAAQIDPTNLKALVRLAQVRLRQGLPYDAAKVLRQALEIDPEYLPALEELKIATRLIETDSKNVYRKRNMVILFHNHEQYQLVDRAFPTLDRLRRRLEDDLKFHLPVLWIKVVNKVQRFHGPPALYDGPEDSIHVEAARLEAGDYAPILHQMVHLYLEKIAHGKLPIWLAEGLALHYVRPPFLRNVELRTTALFPAHIPRDAYVQRTYLDFEANSEGLQRALAKAYVAARYLHETYGVVGVRKLLLTFREGESDWWKAAGRALHLERSVFERRLTIYGVRGHYFDVATNRQHP